MQLINRPVAIHMRRLQTDLPLQGGEIGFSALMVCGHNLVATAIETNGAAEGDVHIERERSLAAVSGRYGSLPVLRIEATLELRGSGVGSVTRAAQVIPADQIFIPLQSLVGQRHREKHSRNTKSVNWNNP